MLGLLYHITHGLAPRQLCELFLFEQRNRRYTTRWEIRRHDMQFLEPRFRTDTLQRSIFGLTVIWNLLPSWDVHLSSVKKFQRAL